MNKTLLLDCEEGHASVQDLIDAGTVQHIPIRTAGDLESATFALVDGELEADVVVLDGLSTLATVTRRQATLDRTGVPERKRFSMRQKIESNFGDYLNMSDILGLLMYTLRNLPSSLIITCHERDNEDEDTHQNVRGPALNNMLFNELVGNSDVLARLSILAKAGTSDGIKVEAGRYLRLRGNDTVLAKVRGTLGNSYPTLVKDPTLRELEKALGSAPKKVVIYGKPGTGKTTMACSLSREEEKHA